MTNKELTQKMYNLIESIQTLLIDEMYKLEELEDNYKTITKKPNKMRKLKVNTKLTIRKVNRMDSIDKTGLAIGIFFILPSVIAIINNVITNGSNLM